MAVLERHKSKLEQGSHGAFEGGTWITSRFLSESSFEMHLYRFGQKLKQAQMQTVDCGLVQVPKKWSVRLHFASHPIQKANEKLFFAG